MYVIELSKPTALTAPDTHEDFYWDTALITDIDALDPKIIYSVNPEIEVIIPPPRERSAESDRVQLEIERLRRRCIVELEHVQQFYAWLDGKRLCRQASLCDWRIPNRKNRSL